MRVVLLVLLTACGLGDDVREGSRAACANNGGFEVCDDAPQTSEGACWRLVSCGAIPVELPMDYQFDYDRCVNFLEGANAGAHRLITGCISSSKCDALLPMNPQDPNPNEISCLHFGAP